jgi:hypothetical protein
MKVYIGPYKNFVGPYQISGWLQKIGVSEERCDKIGDYLNKTWLRKFCEWVESKRTIKKKIKIHNYDTWSMDSTLSHIILPMLKQLKATQHGAPFTDDEDVPEGMGLRSTEAPPKKEEWESDENWFKRWEWIMNEMIWTFEQLSSDTDTDKFYDHSECDYNADVFDWSNSKLKVDREGLEKHEKRIKNGCRLFGKYYQCLWD